MSVTKKIVLALFAILPSMVFAHENGCRCHCCEKEESISVSQPESITVTQPESSVTVKPKSNTFYFPIVVSLMSNELFFASRKNVSTTFAFGIIGSSIYECNGIQSSSVFNVAHNIKGLQSAGVFNVATEMSGFQTSGVFNIASGKASGLQAAGVYNLASKGIDGVQMSGVLNVASGDVKGAQIGLVNICSGNADFQLGLINISGNGVCELAASYVSNDTVRFNISSGMQYLYATLGLITSTDVVRGYDSIFCDYNTISFGGIGTRQKLGPSSLDLEILWNQFANWRSGETNCTWENSFFSGRASIGLKPVKHFAIFAGCTAMLECNYNHQAFSHFDSTMQYNFYNGSILHTNFDAGVRLSFN